MPLSVKKVVCGNEVKVAKSPLVACLTCPLCGQLFREATTICECLHTFCRECIHSRLSDGETNGCPMCHVNLGCLPLEKLRADHQLDDVKAKLFPDNLKKRKPDAVISPVVHATGKRKERSLHSLGLGSVQVANPGFASRKTKWVHKDSSESSDKSSEEQEGGDAGACNNDEDDEELECSTRSENTNGEDGNVDPRLLAGAPKGNQKPPSVSPPGKPGWKSHSPSLGSKNEPGSSSASMSSLVSARRRADQGGSPAPEQVLVPSATEPLNSRGIARGETSSSPKENGVGEEQDFSCPLVTLAEVAGADAARSITSPPSKHPAPATPIVPSASAMEVSPEPLRSGASEEHGTEAKMKRGGTAASSSMNGSAGTVAHKLGAQPHVRRTSTPWTNSKEVFKKSAAVKNSSSGVTGHCSVPCRRNVGGIWFALEAAENQTGESVLPQIASPYLRIRDGRLPVSLVKKYLVKKLGLKNESEVEITCRGQPVVPSLPLESVRNIWFATGTVSSSAPPTSSVVPPSEVKMKRRVDSPTSADGSVTVTDYLMVLTYQKHRRTRMG